MTDPDPLLTPPSIPDKEEDAMLDLLAGLDLEDTSRKYNLPKSRLRSLQESENYAYLKEQRVTDITSRTQALLLECQISAAKALSPAALADDPKLALQFLKETGSLKQSQKNLGQEVQEEDNTIRIEFNDFGLSSSASTSAPPTIDVPSTRLLDTTDDPVD